MSTFDQATLALISRRHVVEVLAQLSDGPHTLRALHRGCPGTRSELHDALRALAVAAAIRRTGTRRPPMPAAPDGTENLGASWDTQPHDDSAYALTTTGRDLAERLNDLDAWTNAYRQYLDQPERRARGR